MSKEVTREEMLVRLEHWASLYWGYEWNPEDVRVMTAILALIEHGPMVSRGFVVNSAKAMGVEPDALHMCLEEAGVTVKEG